jgi:hypothetical protein
MICPKCGKDMYQETCISRPSQLTRQDCSGANVVDGYTCWNCRTWRENPDAEAAVLFRPEMLDNGRTSGTSTQSIVVQFFDVITQQRSAKKTFETIARLLTHEGHRCCDKTLQKYFLLEQRRRGDGEAQGT